ncbi:MAG: T9SS type A sorting domain-containing protein [Ferruginibacter sp.]
MKKKLIASFYSFTILVGVTAQVTRPMAARYNNPSVKGNIVFVANNIVTTPFGITTQMPPGGTSVNNGFPCSNIDVDTDVPAHTVKIPAGSIWDYHSNGAAPVNDGGGLTWKMPAYVLPPAWNAPGTVVPSTPILPPFPAKYGFSNPGSASIVSCMKSSAALPACIPPAGNKYSAYYFRKTVNFTAAELAAFSTVLFRMKRLDGIVVYINGVERIRDNMPAGLIGYGTFARNDLGLAQENTVFYADPSLFNAGVNTIAVEVHTAVAGATNMVFDMELLGINRASTFNSSSATLNLNSCSQVLFAGLYWGANHQQNGNSDTSWIKQETKIKFKVPGSASYQIVTSTQTDYHNGIRLPGPPALVHAGYASFADVTSLINTSNPNGVYTAGDISTPIGWYSGGAGWTLVIAYSNPSEVQRNLTVFDGSAIAKIGVTLNIPVTGFLTPPAGPVSCELGAVVYDGDRALLDNFLFKQDANPLVGSYTNLTPNATSILNDMWNSTISTKGVLNPGRIPSHNNTLGFDADIIEVPNAGNSVLGNNQTSASIRLSSSSEDFMAQVLTTSVSIYNPSFAFDKDAADLSGGSLTPGDSLRYIMSYNNVGNDASTNSMIIDNIPPGTAYKPGSIRINGVAKTDAPGDDEAEYDFVNSRIVYRLGVGANTISGGELAPGSNGDVSFDIYTPSACSILSCGATLRNRARMSYDGKLSLQPLQDSSGVYNSGCIDPVDKIDIVTGTCLSPGDSILPNICQALTVNIPIARYAGYSFYTAMPFIPANRYNPALPVTFTRIIYAYYDAPGACPDDTIRLNIVVTSCPDIDDDNDGIPDYVEMNDPQAWGNHDADANLNWNDPQYPGYIDNNLDLFNDNFDPSADSDNDGDPNFYDTDFPGWTDTNGDGVNDNMDMDLDGIPNHLDLDSDNDGISDAIESFGVDANADGRIDNYSDTDNDGFSQNADANNTGVANSGLGLGPLDTDGDLLPNYLDLDSDNDGIPDVREVFGTDADNDGKSDVFSDVEGDGFSDSIDGDANNDLISENFAAVLLYTSTDANSDGRLDSWPFRNMDNDSKSNPYDLDSDGDGIADVIESNLPDANLNGIVDGVFVKGWSALVSGLPVLTLPNTEGVGNADYLDIESDGDGIPDNIEGMSTLGYLLPTTTDADGDGLMSPYDNFVGFGGTGIILYDKDIDGIPDFRDLDTDQDGAMDICEGNDWNIDGSCNEPITPSGLDADGDGLDDTFDALNSITDIKGTSIMMGNGGSTMGDPIPGTFATVQKQTPAQIDRDWRYVGTVLPIEFLSFSATVQNAGVYLNWAIITAKEVDRFEIERSTNNAVYSKSGTLRELVNLNVQQNFDFFDDISSVSSDVIYYRLKVYGKAGEITYSHVLIVKRNKAQTPVTIMPNPATDFVKLIFYAGKGTQAEILLIDQAGRKLLERKQNFSKGKNELILQLDKFSAGIYSLIITTNEEKIIKQLSVLE